MNKSTLAIVVSIIASASVHAAEVYNKNGNKLDVYGKVKAMHYMSDYDSKDGDQSYVRFGFKGETQINDQLTGYGRWEAEFAGRFVPAKNPPGLCWPEIKRYRFF